MIVVFNISKFRTLAIPLGFLGMAILRLPLSLNPKVKFWKLFGAGKDARPDLGPDFKHWAYLCCFENLTEAQDFLQKNFCSNWFKRLSTESMSVVMQPIAAHGAWDGQKPFEGNFATADEHSPIAVITRAEIYKNKVKRFKQFSPQATAALLKAPGHLLSCGFGESPSRFQGTLSIWRQAEDMKNYAYKHQDHQEIIQLTRQENWYKEELFARLKILSLHGQLNGQHVEHILK